VPNYKKKTLRSSQIVQGTIHRKSFFSFCVSLFILFSIMNSLLHGAAWKTTRAWSELEELGYARWVEQLGQRQWKSAQKMLLNQRTNSLYHPSDERFTFWADCGDLPFILRSYYAYKRGLPTIITTVRGGNYSATPNPTVSMLTNESFQGSAHEFFNRIPNTINTANLRTDYRQGNTSTYPVALNREAIRPGTIFYDPNGHAAVVCSVKNDGTIHFIDAHPDQSITRTIFGPKLSWKTSSHTGGFINYRPVVISRGRIMFQNDLNKLPHLSTMQHRMGKDYHIKTKLLLSKQLLDPEKDLAQYILQDTFLELQNRVAAVQSGWKIAKHNSIKTPPNIYYGAGPWEDFSTPGRDIRLRKSLLHIPERIKNYLSLAQKSPELLTANSRNPEKLLATLIKTQDRLFRTLIIEYPNSEDQLISLTLNDIEKRIFLLSFNPNHPPELRWGATGKELSTASRYYPRYYISYQNEQLWRNRLDTKNGSMATSDRDNPRIPPPHNVTRMVQQIKVLP
jgi:hypothetical protein